MITLYRLIQRIERNQQGSTHTLAILLNILMSMLRVCLEYANSMPRVCLGYAWSMARVCLGANILFPHWEQNIPTLGTKHSHLGNKTGLRLALDDITAHSRRDYGSFATRVSLLLLLTLGSGSVWGQTGTNYSGLYYFVNRGSGKSGDSKIADITNPDNYFYLVPADNPQQGDKRDAWFSSDYSTANGDPEKPYLTTYRTRKDAAAVPTGVTNRPHNSVWIVKFASTDNGTDYYNLIHVATGKYVVYEPPYSSKNNRKSMHLLTTDSPGENAKFAITRNDDYYNFRPKSIGTGASTNKYLNPTQQNYNAYYSSDAAADNPADYFRGLVGLWKNNGTNSDGTGSDWMLESTLLTAPTIDYNSEENIFSISYNLLPTGYTILYTIDGSDPAPKVGGSTMEYTDESVIKLETIGSYPLKAVVVRYGMILSETAS